MAKFRAVFEPGGTQYRDSYRVDFTLPNGEPRTAYEDTPEDAIALANLWYEDCAAAMRRHR